jgi:hypothetical protein
MADMVWWQILAGAALACAWSASAPAADQARHPCAEVSDDSRRLACYDTEFGRPGHVPDRPAAPAPAVAAAAGAAAGPSAAPAAAVDADFGLSKWAKRSQNPEAAKAPQRITARILQVERQRDGRFVVTLDNEQVWRQIETMSRARVAVGDEVTIREAALGSFLLVTAGDVATRVRRVK